jgi:hypothetical protein
MDQGIAAGRYSRKHLKVCSAWTTLEFRSLLPYFHNGGEATLEQVVDCYNRGGDRRGEDGNDTTRFGPTTVTSTRTSRSWL